MVRLGGYKKTYPKKKAETQANKPEGETAEAKVEGNIQEGENRVQPNINTNVNTTNAPGESAEPARKVNITINF
jgi:hypothetical protein